MKTVAKSTFTAAAFANEVARRAGMNGGQGAGVYGRFGADTGFIQFMSGGSTSWEILLPPDEEEEANQEN
ncbi:MAG: hypothetical protein ACRC62_18180 [Microcoleus sp.]